jgi:hypothetical protein
VKASVGGPGGGSAAASGAKRHCAAAREPLLPASLRPGALLTAVTGMGVVALFD